jgi:hypothetical protein
MSSPKDKGKAKRKNRKDQNYKQRSQAVCVVAYNSEGRPIPDGLSNEIADAVSEIAVREGLFVSLTRS